ncbi:MAG: hypothetical protein Q4B70_02690, partial [Lachnospiraceae bacterium]|nr:hypothetical protein [Lachnospiraceae bacterium]
MKKMMFTMLTVFMMSICMGSTLTVNAAEGNEATTATATETTTQADKTTEKVKKGNCDKYIGLSSSYMVLATAKKTVKVYKKQSTKSTVLGKFTKNNCIVVNTKGMKKGKNYSWLKVYLKNKKTGYIRVSQISLGKLNTKNFGLKTST